MPQVSLRITREMPQLDPTLDAVVERHWQAAQRGRRLFNGRVFCADRIAPDLIEGHWTEYRRVIAQMADHTLLESLGVRSLAVCGVLSGPDGVAVGLREARSTYQAGLWQLPPAGSVDSGAAIPGGADWRRAMLGELKEELGIEPEKVGELRPLCLVQHPSGVLDMGVRIPTSLTAAAILEKQRGAVDQEYERLLVTPAEAVVERITAEGGRLVPPAHAFLALAAERSPSA